MVDLGELRFDDRGLLPAVIQDWRDGTVLMVGYMNREALEKTVATRSVHFWSRSRQRLWEKGETSGNRLLLKEIFVDCDHDTILVKAEPTGPVCHTGEPACFFRRVEEGGAEGGKTLDAHGGILDAVYRTVLKRRASMPADSYVVSLFQGGQDKILKKVAEEAGEVLVASKNGKPEEVIHEVADLLFHTLVMLGYHDIPLHAIYEELAGRFGQPPRGTAMNKESRGPE